MELIYNLEDLPDVAEKILAYSNSDILLFYGKMGVGKTTLIKEICNQLDVEDVASSPSFGIVNEYLSPQGPIYHFDFYRIEDSQEAIDLGIDEYMYSGQKVLVEWPEKVSELLPDDALKIFIEIKKNGMRKLHFSRTTSTN